jgi:hypothetical protein
MNAADRLVLITTRHRPHNVAALAEYWASTGKVVIYVDREAAQSYLESYFGKDNIKVYWQTSNRFLADLQGGGLP